MADTKLDRVIDVLVDKGFGLHFALAVHAALEVANNRWTPEDTIMYGARSLQELSGLIAEDHTKDKAR